MLAFAATLPALRYTRHGMTTEPDPSRCSLCGGPNACALALPEADRPPECWCRSERFPEALLTQAPPTACICQRCLRESAVEAASGSRDRESGP